MSLVGTRPPTVDEWDKYELHHRARLATKPGLTGMWQVSGRSKNDFVRNMFATWWRAFRSSSNFRRTFLLAFYTAMILLRTVLNREIWFDPLKEFLLK